MPNDAEKLEDIKMREFLGQMVREEWIAWAREQPNPKPSWLVPWEGLSEPDREVDRRIGERLFRHGLSFAARALRNLESENDSLRRTLGPALQDTERLDWLSAHPLQSEIKGGSDDGHTGKFWGCGSANLSLRETIDTISAMPPKAG